MLLGDVDVVVVAAALVNDVDEDVLSPFIVDDGNWFSDEMEFGSVVVPSVVKP